MGPCATIGGTRQGSTSRGACDRRGPRDRSRRSARPYAKVRETLREGPRDPTPRSAAPYAKVFETLRQGPRDPTPRSARPYAKVFGTERQGLRHRTRRSSAPNAKVFGTERQGPRDRTPRSARPNAKVRETLRQGPRDPCEGSAARSRRSPGDIEGQARTSSARWGPRWRRMRQSTPMSSPGRSSFHTFSPWRGSLVKMRWLT